MKNRHSVRLMGVVSGLLVATAMLMGSPAPVTAAVAPGGGGGAGATAEWVNRNTVLVNGRYYTDNNPADANAEFSGTIAEYGTCAAYVRFKMATAYNGPGGTLYNLDTPDSSNYFYYIDGVQAAAADWVRPSGKKDAGGNFVCNDTVTTKIGVSKNYNRMVSFIKIDADTIINYKNLIKFKHKSTFPSGLMYRREDEPDPCADIIYLARPVSDDNNGDYLGIWNGGQAVPNPGGTVQSAVLYGVRNSAGARSAESYAPLFNINQPCPIDNQDLYSQGVFAAVSDKGNRDENMVEAFISRGIDQSGNAVTANNSNDDTFVVFVGDLNNLPKDANGNPIVPNPPGLTLNQPTCKGQGLGWVICPVVTAIQNIANAIQDAVASMLRVNPLPLDSTSPVYTVWENMRNFSNIAFVLVFMVIIFSQATSIGLSSYGIKSMLPRLIAVAILSNISYYLCSFAIDIFNILGVGIDNLFSIANGGSQGTTYIGPETGALALGTLAAVIGVTITTGAIVELFPLIVAAFFAVLIVFMVLIIRQALIILVVVASPIILVLGILPGTRQYSTGALNMFMTLLVMYPMIIGLFAAARIASAILTQLGGA